MSHHRACVQVKIGELGYANLWGRDSAPSVRLKRTTLNCWQAPEVSTAVCLAVHFLATLLRLLYARVLPQKDSMYSMHLLLSAQTTHLSAL
jgi:hypothetical protein